VNAKLQHDQKEGGESEKKLIFHWDNVTWGKSTIGSCPMTGTANRRATQ
jgi:hypothetical protein